MKLSFCVMTNAASGRVAAIVELVRPVVDEVVIAVDDRTPEGEIGALQALADEVRLFPYREPADAAIPWLYSLCSGDWILNVDHDEIPSPALIEALPGLVQTDAVSHYWLLRRWLWPDAAHYLDEPPWAREPVPRLVRNDPQTLRFSDEFHRPFVLEGPSRFLEQELWHADFLLRDEGYRRQKALDYERRRRGMRIAGVAHNAGFYLPELRSGARVAEVPEADRALIERVLAAPDPPTATPRPAARAAVSELDRLWPGGWSDRLHRGRVEHVERVELLTAGVQQTIAVRVTNESDRAWLHGGDAMPEVRLGYRFDPPDWDDPALRTPFPADLAPGESQVVPVHVVPPARPGRYRLELDLLHEHVRWFGVGVETEVDVRPRRRIALIGQGDPLEAELDRLLLEPELEPVIVVRGEELQPQRHGHPRIPGLRDYLLAGVEDAPKARLLATLAARTRGAKSQLAGLAGCERLVIVSTDWPEGEPVVRELWRLAATARAARALGVPVEVRPGVLDRFTRSLERMLAADIRRHA